VVEQAETIRKEILTFVEQRGSASVDDLLTALRTYPRRDVLRVLRALLESRQDGLEYGDHLELQPAKPARYATAR